MRLRSVCGCGCGVGLAVGCGAARVPFKRFCGIDSALARHLLILSIKSLILRTFARGLSEGLAARAPAALAGGWNKAIASQGAQL